jgi:hypothetical protein
MVPVTAWRIGLVLIALAALVLRLRGVGFGLPAVYNPDEVAILNRALALGTGTLNPGNFVYPSLYFYVLVVWEGLAFVGGRLLGVFASLADFQRAYFVDASWHYLAGRLLTVVCGVATVGLVARIGALLYDRAVGLMAAALLAVAPFAVRDAHYIKHDVPVTLLVVMTIGVAARLAIDSGRRGRSLAWLAAGGLAGLAASTHYYAVFVAVAVAASALMARPDEPWPRRMRHVLLAGAAAVLAFAAGSPYLLLDAGTAWADISANRAIVMDRAMSAAGTFGSAGSYARMLAIEAAGWPVFLAAVLGAAFAVRDDWRRAVVWLAFPAVFLPFLANTVPAGRYLNPVLPVVALAAASAIRRGTAALPRPMVAAASLCLLAALPGVFDSIRIGQFFREPDTRTLAAELIVREVPPGAGVLLQPYSVALRPSRESLVRALRAHLGSETLASPRFRGQLALSPYPTPSYDLLWLGEGGLDTDKIYLSPAVFTREAGLTPLKTRGVHYVVLNQSSGTNTAFSGLEAALAAEATLIARIVPWDDRAAARPPAPFLHNTDRTIAEGLVRPGPVVEIWSLR